LFEALTSRLQETFQTLGRRGKLRPEDVDAALRDVRLALLDADVHYQVVKNLLESVRVRALGEDVSRALNPAQQVISIIHEELVLALGEPAPLTLTGPAPRVILLIGLQGSGKTTTAAKLAKMLRTQGERVWLIAADPYRPAAVEQLSVLGEKLGVPVYNEGGKPPPELCSNGVGAARKGGASVVIIDTAGRSQLDDEMMHELQAVRQSVHPTETLLVADAMTGQEAVQIAQGFQSGLGITGLILTKMDGDARGGAAISMRSVTGVPIKLIGVGESLDALEQFDPDRLASRILGRGDIQGILEKAQGAIDPGEAGQQAERMMQGEFTLEDFSEQLQMVRKMGPIGKIIEMLPTSMVGFGSDIDQEAAEKQVIRTQAILHSMTREERSRPEILNASRKRRVAGGSGTSVQEINQLLRQYKQMRRLMKQVGKGGFPKRGLWPR
jgi:signal recognition particle subunit SRP54